MSKSTLDKLAKLISHYCEIHNIISDEKFKNDIEKLSLGEENLQALDIGADAAITLITQIRSKCYDKDIT